MKPPKKKRYARHVKDFIKGVKMTVGTNYSSRRSIKRNDKGVMRYRAAAEAIGIYYADKISEFETLLDHTKRDVRICASICLVELMPCTEEQKAHAISVVAECARDAGEFDGQGLVLWINRHSGGAL